MNDGKEQYFNLIKSFLKKLADEVNDEILKEIFEKNYKKEHGFTTQDIIEEYLSTYRQNKK